MNLDALLALFASCDRHGVEYAVAGDLAGLMRGRVALTERLEIAIRPDEVERTRSAITQVWPDSHITNGPDVLMRVLPSNTPFYVDVIARAVLTSELVRVREVRVRVLVEGNSVEERDMWSRPGFTVRERLAALLALTRELVPPHALAGVRKYRSIEAMEADREQWDRKRADSVRAERLRK